eukprot:TRINITY_DN10164_c0_g6_i1.p1 TRINITY_DN10164_c0_g6~~TRINITY_DN10164_c0_g6_i1.p1  ORF type:complete len:229 (-),score=70.05 TRINITY_DN10164_c0_g6_i1:170-856(-)
MKRNSAETTSSTITSFPKSKPEAIDQTFSQIFTIARIEKGVKMSESDRLRVGVSSKVNFSKLTPKEQLLRFQNQAEEIQKLRRRLSKLMLSKGKHEATDLQRAVDRVKAHKYELDDQKSLIENIVRGINQGSIAPNSLAYNQICTILREALHITPVEAKYRIKLGEAEVPVSMLEYETYSKLPCTPAVLRTLLGKEQERPENLGELLRVLNLQAFAKTVNAEMTPTMV